MEKNTQNLKLIKSIMIAVNFFSILFLSILIYQGTMNICWNQNARDFIKKLHSVPLAPWQIPLFSVFFLGVVYMLIIARDKITKETRYLTELIIVIDVVLCGMIVYLTNLSYKGILLLAIINVLTYLKSKKRKYFFTIMIMLI